MTIQTETPNQLVLKEGEWPKKAGAVFLIIIGLVIISLFWNSNIIWYSPFIILGAVLLILSSKTVTITIGKAREKISFNFAGLLEKTKHEIDLNLIKGVVLEEDIPYSRIKFLNYWLVFNLGNNQAINIPINSPAQDFSIRGSTSFLWGERNSITALAKKIADFIGVKLVDHKLPF